MNINLKRSKIFFLWKDFYCTTSKSNWWRFNLNYTSIIILFYSCFSCCFISWFWCTFRSNFPTASRSSCLNCCTCTRWRSASIFKCTSNAYCIKNCSFRIFISFVFILVMVLVAYVEIFGLSTVVST